MPFAKSCSFLATVALTLKLSIGSAAIAQAWPSAPSQLSLTTPYGHIQVSQSDYVYEARLMLDQKIIEPEVKGLLNLPYSFTVGDSQSVLISIDTGLGMCPVSFRWLTIDKHGHHLSDTFGSCNHHIRVSNQGATLIVHTPDQQDSTLTDEYRYNGGYVSHRKKRLKQKTTQQARE